MIGRAILALFAAVIVTSGISDMGIARRASQTPKIFAPSDVGKIDPAVTPFVQIDGIVPADGICVYRPGDRPNSIRIDENVYYPILTAAQAARISRRQPVTISAVVRFEGCQQKDLSSSITGVVSRDRSQIPAVYSNGLAKDKLSLASDVLILEQRGVPPSTMSGIGEIAGGLALLPFVVVPFFSRRRKFDEKKLAAADLAGALEELRPLVSCSPVLLGPSIQNVHLMTGDAKEIVLLLVNCNVENIPSIMVITNTRLLIFRTKSKTLPMIGRTISKLLDKGAEMVPGAGLVLLALDPFFETFDVLFVREERGWRENLGFEDAEILEGRVPWKKLSDFRFAELPVTVRSISASKDWLYRSATVRFHARSLKKVLSLPKDMEIPDVAVLPVVNRLIGEIAPILLAAGCKVLTDKPKTLNLELPTPQPAS